MQNQILSSIPEYLSLGVVFYDKNGFLKYANNVAFKMFGTTIKEVYDVNIFEDPNITDEDKAELRKGLNVSFETDYDFDLCGEQFFNTGIRGRRKYFVTKVVIMRDNEGILQGYLLTCEDVTEKKAQEQKIIESHKKIKETQKELSLALNVGKLMSWNYKVEEQMFYKFSDQIEEIEKWSLNEICNRIHSDYKERFLTLLEDICHKKELNDNNIVLRISENGDDDYRYCNFTYSARDDENGSVAVITFVQRDITEDVKYQQNLILAKNKAEEADKLKSAFLANMSHEIRTPLNAIVGFSALLSEAESAADKKEYKQLIETNTEILLKLIGDILDLSKIEVGSIDIKRQKLDIAGLCDELYRSFKQRIKSSDVTLKLENPYGKCIVNLDKQRVIQIFTNFVTNAIKYTPKGEIVMGYECITDGVRLYVKDSGIGIPDEKKCRIFGRFEKLDDFAQGTGLGLSICKAIAEATHGEIGFESEENVGSEFWYIGYTDVEFVEKSQLSELITEEEIESEDIDDLTFYGENIKDLNILIAEDNNSNFTLISKILKNNNLTRAVNGVEAVEKAKSQPFDIIFMDIRMPELNGLEATYMIREFDTTTPIVAITANAFDSDKEAALDVGCNYFMTKPLKKRELIKVLAEFCK